MPSMTAFAQSYPSKPVRLIVPFPPGGSTDTLARLLGSKLGETWKQQFMIDNRPGASGVIGTELGAKAPPDGYTLLMGSGGPLTILPGLMTKLPYDPIKDFAPITVMAAVPNLIATHPSVPVKNVKELIALARSRPDQLGFSSNGAGTPGHLAGELLKTMASVRMTHVPYKGAAGATMAVLTGDVALTITTTTAILPLAKAGRLRIIAATTLQRLPQLPDVPTVAESDLPRYEAISWFGLVAPAAVPADIVRRITVDTIAAINTPEMRSHIASHGATPVANTPEQMRQQIRDDYEKWVKIIKASGAKAE